MELGEGIKKILLAGIGTAAVTAEKSKEVLDELVKKGELTVEQGKVLNQELKHNIKESVKKNVNVTLKPSNPDELKEVLGKMTPDQLAALKERGVNVALAGTLGVAQQAMELGFTVWGDYGLGVYNSQSLKELKRLGFSGAAASFELTSHRRSPYC